MPYCIAKIMCNYYMSIKNKTLRAWRDGPVTKYIYYSVRKIKYC